MTKTEASKSADNWLENLRAGDPVMRFYSGSTMSLTPETVLRVTKTMVVLVNGERYSRSTGGRIGPGLRATGNIRKPKAATGSAQ